MFWLLLLLPSPASPMSHWIVTEDGHIQAPGDSLFTMRKSHDLVQFMRQEERIKQYNEAQADMDLQKATIAESERRDDPKLEEKLMTTDRDCLRAGKPLAQHSLHSQYAIPLHSVGIEMEEMVGEPKTWEYQQQPHCVQFFHLPFSPYAFEHLPSMKDDERGNLSMAPESALIELVHPDWRSTLDYGHAIFLAMAVHPLSWVVYNQATFYWRILGNAPEAIECVRRALHLTPREYLGVPLLNLGQILHQSSKSADAAVIMDVLLEAVPQDADAFCAAAEVFAVAQRLNDSRAAFEACLAILPDSASVAATLAAVNCHIKLEAALEAQHQIGEEPEGEEEPKAKAMGKDALEFEPGEQVEFKGSFQDPTSVEVKVKNETGKRMAYKVKTSDNDLFKIRPVMGFVKEGESGAVVLVYTAKEKGKAPKEGGHHFSLYQLEAKDDAKSARKLWEDPEAKKVKRNKKIKVVFAAEGGDDKKEDGEKKDGDKKEEKKEDGDKKEEKKDEEKKDEDKKEEKKEEEKKEEEKKE